MKKIISFILSLIMAFCVFPLSAAANNGEAVSGHTHSLKTEIRPAEVGNYEEIDSHRGAVAEVCEVDGCTYEKLTEIPAVQYVCLSETKYTYDGKLKKPAPVVTLENGRELDKSQYTVKYYNNKSVGRGYADIVFKDKYFGTLRKVFKINPKGTSVTKLTAGKKAFSVKIKKQSNQTTGYEIQYAQNKAFTKGKKSLKTKETKKDFKKLKSKKKYYVRVRTYKTVGGRNYYSVWSKAKSVKVK